jgi:hypothetical protein
MNREGTADASIDWAQIFPDNAIDYTASQQVIAEKITEAVERIKSDPVARQKFEDACRAAIKKLEKLHHSSTSKLVKEFGTGGAEQVANAVEEFAAKHTALEATQALKTKEYFAMAGGINASFTSDSEIGLSELQRLHLAAHLPRIQPLEHAPKVIDVQIHHSESGETTMQQNGSHVELSDNWNGKLSPDFPYLFYGAARLAWLNKNMYPVHAACVGNENDGYVLLVGHSGVGKTSSTLQSAFSSGLKVFSGDKTLITIANDGEMRAIGGTKTMTIRAEDKKRWPSLEGQGLMNGDRYIFPLKPEQSSSEFSVKIKAIVLLKLNDGVTKCQKLTPLSSLHTMYPYFMDMEWNDVLVGSGKAVFDGTPNNSVKPQLAQRLGNSLNQIPTFNISGSLPRVTSMINSIANANEQDIQRIHLRLGQGRQL